MAENSLDFIITDGADLAKRASTLQRLDSKAMLSLMGICSGLIADNELKDVEIHYLSTWLAENKSLQMMWPGSAIYLKVQSILDDGIITSAERADLLDFLQQITGNFFSETGAAAPELPALPIDDDPSVFFKHMSFCFTGKFILGTRAYVERLALKLGGTAVDNVSKKLNYLVIGSLINPQWYYESYGRKIEKAAQLRDNEGVEIIIISERQWTNAVNDTLRPLKP